MSWEDQQPAPINHPHYASTINVQLCRRRSVTMLYLVTIICIMHHTNRTKPPATCLVIEDGLKACVHGPEQEPGSPMHGLTRQTGFSSERYGSMHARAQPLHPTPHCTPLVTRIQRDCSLPQCKCNLESVPHGPISSAPYISHAAIGSYASSFICAHTPAGTFSMNASPLYVSPLSLSLSEKKGTCRLKGVFVPT